MSQVWDWEICKEVVNTSTEPLREYGEHGYLVFALDTSFSSAWHGEYSEEYIHKENILWIKKMGEKIIFLSPIYKGDLNIFLLAKDFFSKNIKGEVQII